MAKEKRQGLRGFVVPRMRTLRWRLTAILAGIVAVIIGVGLAAWQVADRSSHVVDTAARIHERTQTLSRLQVATDELQRASYAQIRLLRPEAEQRAVLARQEYESALDAAVSLPVRSRREREISASIAAQGEAVSELFSSARQVVSEVNNQWEEGGAVAALQEVDRLSQPYFSLVETLTNEIRVGDRQLRQATQEAKNAQLSLAMLGSVGVALALGLTALALFLILTRLGPGLKRLEKGVAHLGEGDPAEAKIDIAGRDELAALAAAFNSMTDRIEQQQQALRDVSQGLENAIAERTQELALAHQRLSQEDMRRRRFIAEISHELRTPITIIRGEADVALRNMPHEDSENAASFERIYAQTRSLGRLVNDLFLLAKAEVGGLDLAMSEFDLSRLMHQIVSDFEPIASARQGRIIDLVNDGVKIVGDEERVRQIIASLIDNALRHTQPGVEVVVGLEQTATGARATISDDGPGVASDQIENLFRRFMRGTRRTDSSGLGLTIARALAQAHGGTCVLCVNPEHGLKAEVELPFEPDTQKLDRSDGEDEAHVEFADSG